MKLKPTFDGCIEDWRDDTCALCGKDCNPHIRHCWGIHTEEEGDIVSMELITCVKCASKVSERNWRDKEV